MAEEPIDVGNAADAEAINSIDGLADAVRSISQPEDERRMIFAKGENYRHIR